MCNGSSGVRFSLGFGTLALAVAARGISPLALVPILCISGIADASTWRPRGAAVSRHDAVAYAVAGVACATVAWKHGDTLVHPHFTYALAASAAALFFLAWRHRAARFASVRWAPVAMIAAALAAAPALFPTAESTTIGDAYAGQQLRFSGMLMHSRGSDVVARYRITCCRADAQPVAVTLRNPLPLPPQMWVSVEGVFVKSGGRLVVAVARYRAERAPADPFIYR